MENEIMIFLIKFLFSLKSILQFYNFKNLYKINSISYKLLNKIISHFLGLIQEKENIYYMIAGWNCNNLDLVVKDNKSYRKNIYRSDLHKVLGEDYAFCGFEIIKLAKMDLRISLKEKNGDIKKITIIDSLLKHQKAFFNENDISDEYPKCFRHEGTGKSCGYVDRISMIFRNFHINYKFSFDLLTSKLEYVSSDNVNKLICVIHKINHLRFLDDGLIRLLLCQPQLRSFFVAKVFYCPTCKAKIDLNLNKFFSIELLEIAKDTRKEVESQKEVDNFEFIRLRKNFYKVINIGNIVEDKALESNVSIVRDVHIYSPDVLIKGQKLLEHDFSAAPFQGFVAGRHKSVNGINKNLDYCYINQAGDLEVENIDEGFLLTGRCPENWYHSMIEYIPRILYYNKFDQTPLLVSADINPRAMEVFDIFDLRKNIKFLYSNKAYRVKKLIVPKPLSYGLDDPSHDWMNANNYNFKVIHSFFLDLKSRIPSKNYSFDKVFSFRDSVVRSILNFDEIEYVLDKYDYSILDFTEFSLSDQVNILRGVSHMIAPAGATMANFPYLKKGANVLSLIAKHNQKALIVPTMTSFFGINHYQYLAKSKFSELLKAPNNLNRIHLPYLISKKHFSNSVKEFTKTLS